MSQNKQRMCVVNPDLVDEICPLAGGQCEIMTRMGSSWNGRKNVVSALPLRHSLAHRFKVRVLTAADRNEGFLQKFPLPGDCLDYAALDDAFLLPTTPMWQELNVLRPWGTLRRPLRATGSYPVFKAGS